MEYFELKDFLRFFAVRRDAFIGCGAQAMASVPWLTV